MHVANCEYLLLSISCERNADQSLFVVDLNERRSDSTNLVWSFVVGIYKNLLNSYRYPKHIENYPKIIILIRTQGFVTLCNMQHFGHVPMMPYLH